MNRQHAHVRLLTALAVAATAACRSAGPPQRDAGADSLPTPAPAPAAGSARTAGDRVLPGLEVLVRDSLALVRGKRVGLITNQTAVSHTGQHAVDLLARTPGVRLAALFGPEHGVRGTYEGGARVENQVDSATGVPVYSLYGRTQKPTPEMLRGIDVLLFDIQDIGARPYTFVWTMALAMEAAAAQRIPFIVLDRPNPITSVAQGPMMA
ncbi:MAG TPA: exo-beta-N-acetylmuramidase NamZ domain-containing protein, partial [Longimicrobium sp.]